MYDRESIRRMDAERRKMDRVADLFALAVGLLVVIFVAWASA